MNLYSDNTDPLLSLFFPLCATDAVNPTCSQIPKLSGSNPQTLSSALGDRQHSRKAGKCLVEGVRGAVVVDLQVNMV